jgi:hypothetical protein
MNVHIVITVPHTCVPASSESSKMIESRNHRDINVTKSLEVKTIIVDVCGVCLETIGRAARNNHQLTSLTIHLERLHPHQSTSASSTAYKTQEDSRNSRVGKSQSCMHATHVVDHHQLGGGEPLIVGGLEGEHDGVLRDREGDVIMAGTE